jgi:hypothetical protein
VSGTDRITSNCIVINGGVSGTDRIMSNYIVINGGVSGTDRITSNYIVINDLHNKLKAVLRDTLWPNLRCCPSIFVEEREMIPRGSQSSEFAAEI